MARPGEPAADTVRDRGRHRPLGVSVWIVGNRQGVRDRRTVMRTLIIAVLTISTAACGSAADDAGGTEGPGSERAAPDAPWRVLVETEVVETQGGLWAAADDGALADGWSAAGLPGSPPSIDFETSIVAIESMSFGSGCRPIFMRVSTRGEPGTAELQYVGFEPGTECAADERWYAVAVAIDRATFDPEPTAIAWRGELIAIP